MPIKSFSAAKGRLAERLGATERRGLAEAMASRVLAAAHPLEVHVVCDDPEVAVWAADRGAGTIEGGPGLDRAVSVGLNTLGARGVRRVVVAHGDLPLAEELASLADAPGGGVVIVTDRHGDGTNVLSVPTGVGFTVAYGPGSRRRHIAEARRLDLTVTVIGDGPLCWDVDVPDDLTGPVAELLEIADTTSAPLARGGRARP